MKEKEKAMVSEALTNALKLEATFGKGKNFSIEDVHRVFDITHEETKVLIDVLENMNLVQTGDDRKIIKVVISNDIRISIIESAIKTQIQKLLLLQEELKRLKSDA